MFVISSLKRASTTQVQEGRSTVSGITPISGWSNRVGSLTIGSKTGPQGIPLLQVADFRAFLAAKKVANAPDGKTGWSKYFDKLLAGRRIFQIVHVDKGSLDKLHGLHEDLKREQVEGRSPWDDF